MQKIANKLTVVFPQGEKQQTESFLSAIEDFNPDTTKWLDWEEAGICISKGFKGFGTHVLFFGADKAERLGLGKLLATFQQPVYKGNTQNIDYNLQVMVLYAVSKMRRVKTDLVKFALAADKLHSDFLGITQESTQYKVVTTEQQLRTVCGYIKQVGLVAYDFETHKIDKKLGVLEEGFKATMLSLSFNFGAAYIIPLEHYESPVTAKQARYMLDILGEEVFSNPNVHKIAHNHNFELWVLSLYGITNIKGRLTDTMLQAHLLDETQKVGLKSLVKHYFPLYADYDKELKNYSWDKTPIDLLAQYNALDSDLTLRLYTQLEIELLEQPRLYKIFRNLSMAAFKPLFEAEQRGLLIDKNFLETSIEEVEDVITGVLQKMGSNPVVKRYQLAVSQQTVQEEIQHLTEKLERWQSKHKNFTKTEEKYKKQLRELKTGALGEAYTINYNSTKQLASLLFNHPKGFKFDGDSTQESVLKELLETALSEAARSFLTDLMLYKKLTKNQSVYLAGMLPRLDKSNRVHTHFKLNGTRSGRLSSVSPNLQNIPSAGRIKEPVLSKAVKRVKECFIAPPDHVILQVDYSQAELRVIAEFAQEEAMLKAYREGKDLHALGAAAMLRKTYEQFYALPKEDIKRYRTKAKARNFGLIYGMSADGFKEYAKNTYGLDVTLEEAKKERNAFFTMYPRLLDYHTKYIQKGKKDGFVRTLFGRKRHLPNINNPDEYLAAMEERAAINSPIQGTAGELTIFAIAILFHRLPSYVKLVNTVHDSIIFYIPKARLKQVIPIIKEACENLPTETYFNTSLSIPMKVDFEISEENWASLEEISS